MCVLFVRSPTDLLTHMGGPPPPLLPAAFVGFRQQKPHQHQLWFSSKPLLSTKSRETDFLGSDVMLWDVDATERVPSLFSV